MKNLLSAAKNLLSSSAIILIILFAYATPAHAQMPTTQVDDVNVSVDILTNTVTLNGPYLTSYNAYDIYFNCHNYVTPIKQTLLVDSSTTLPRWTVTYDFNAFGVSQPDSCGVTVYAYSAPKKISVQKFNTALVSSSSTTNDSYVNISFLTKKAWHWVTFFVRLEGAAADQSYTYVSQDDKINTFKVPLLSGAGNYSVRAWASTAVREPNLCNEIYLGEQNVTNLDTQSNPYLMSSPSVLSDTPFFIDFAKSLVGSETDPLIKTKALYVWVTNNIQYDLDMLNDLNTHPESALHADAARTMMTRKGICQDYAQLLITLLRAQQIPSRRISGDAVGVKGQVLGSHAWVEAQINGRWILLDPTWDAGGIMSKTQADGTKKDQFVQRPTLEYFDADPVKFATSHINGSVTLE
jgi:hypothetical protein